MAGLDQSITLHSLYQAVHPDDRKDLTAFLRRLAGGERSEGEFRVRHASGQTRLLYCVGRQTRAAGGLISVDGVMMDVTVSRAAELNLRMSQEELSDARVRALRYQVNPHFLFNSLSAVSTLIVEGEQLRADDMVLKLAAFYRESLKQDPLSLVTLAEEVRMQEIYLSIEEIRFPELKADFEIPKDLANILVPSLILQPLVENAVKYGVTVEEELRIQIKARRKGERAIVSVTDNGRGNKKKGGTGWGLRITERRLELAFPNEYQFVAGPLPGRGFSVAFEIPIRLRTPLDGAGRVN
jgi:LytS/YehU family sensor histidine kinase